MASRLYEILRTDVFSDIKTGPWILPVPFTIYVADLFQMYLSSKWTYRKTSCTSRIKSQSLNVSCILVFSDIETGSWSYVGGQSFNFWKNAFDVYLSFVRDTMMRYDFKAVPPTPKPGVKLFNKTLWSILTNAVLRSSMLLEIAVAPC